MKETNNRILVVEMIMEGLGNGNMLKWGSGKEVDGMGLDKRKLLKWAWRKGRWENW